MWRIVCYFGTSFFMCVQKRVHKKQKSVRTNVPTLFLLVRKMGLEPTRHRHTHLKRACLPIPALPQIAFDCKKDSSTFGGIKSSPISYLFSCPIKQPLQPFLSFITVILARKPFVGAVFAPTAHIRSDVGGGVLDAPAITRTLRADMESAPTKHFSAVAFTSTPISPLHPHPRSGYPRLRGHRR